MWATWTLKEQLRSRKNREVKGEKVSRKNKLLTRAKKYSVSKNSATQIFAQKASKVHKMLLHLRAINQTLRQCFVHGENCRVLIKFTITIRITKLPVYEEQFSVILRFFAFHNFINIDRRSKGFWKFYILEKLHLNAKKIPREVCCFPLRHSKLNSTLNLSNLIIPALLEANFLRSEF